MSKITDMSVVELAGAIAAGQCSAVEATESYLQAIAAREGAVKAYNEVLADRAMEQAKAVDAARAAGKKLGPDRKSVV